LKNEFPPSRHSLSKRKEEEEGKKKKDYMVIKTKYFNLVAIG
jgi:hypothetical protein